MASGIFRKTSIDRVSSPEQLNDYIRVTRPAVWVVLVLGILMLCAMLALFSVGKVETTVNASLYVEEGKAYCYATLENAAQIEQGMTVRVGDVTGTVTGKSGLPLRVDEEDIALFVAYVDGKADVPYMYEVYVDLEGLQNGRYKAEVVTDEVRPIDFIVGA